ncbi:MAG: ROK family protein [Thermoguttaceae bacterium]
MSQDSQATSTDKLQPPYFAGVAASPAGAHVGIVDDRGRTVWRFTEPTASRPGVQEILALVQKAAREANLGPAGIAGLGLCMPEAADVSELANECRLPVTRFNDVDAAAYGEQWVGAGREFHSLALITLDAAIGCGIVLGDQPGGENCRGSQLGHIIIDCKPGARLCACGQPGHLAAYASATALIDRIGEALDAGRPSSLRNRLAKGQTPSLALVADEASSGDALSLEAIAETARFVAVGLASLMHTVDPSGILLAGPMTFGGSQTPLGRQFLAWVREEIGRRAFPILTERTVVAFAALGEDAGWIGAAGLARRHLTRSA